MQFFGGYWALFEIITWSEPVLDKWSLKYKEYLRICFTTNKLRDFLKKKKKKQTKINTLQFKEVTKVFVDNAPTRLMSVYKLVIERATTDLKRFKVQKQNKSYCFVG